MASFKSLMKCRSWKKDQYFISTDITLISIPKLISIFASDECYWAKALPAPAMQEMLENSLCFALYELAPGNSVEESPDLSSRQFIGIARCVTDYTTFVYLTDVWVDLSHQGLGLGTWLVECIQESIKSMPFLRRSMLFTADWTRSVPFYEKLMDMRVLETGKGTGLAIMERKGPGHPTYGKESSDYN
ncbi:hypothetical protein GQ53DRAFT_170512 [Thozetella sp. PMI_491]|nr:hypothetical protein GQ53DRAFT_170512 [Thozetella sp. PMI_491]